MANKMLTREEQALQHARAELKERVQDRTAELARSNALLGALGRVAARLETTRDPETIMDFVGSQLRELGLFCMFAHLDVGAQALVLDYVTADWSALTAVEQLSGITARGYRMPWAVIPEFDHLLIERRAVFIPDEAVVGLSAAPNAPRHLVERAMRLCGIQSPTHSIIAPLVVEGELFGVLELWGNQLTQEDIPAASTFASQLSAALQNARLFDRIQTELRERTRAERAVRESEERYRQLFESNPHPMWVYDLETLAFLAVNEAAIQHYGYSREEFLSMTIKDIRPPEDVPALLQDIAQTNSGFKQAGVWKHRTRDGALIDVEITSHTLIVAGRPARLVQANDITQRRLAEAALSASERRFRALIENGSDGIVLVDREGKVLYTSPSTKKILGGGEDSRLGGSWLRRVHPDDVTKVSQLFDQLIQEPGATRRAEFRYRHFDGTWLVLEAIATNLLSEPAVLAIVANFRDNTGRKRAHDAIEHERNLLRTLMDSLPDYIYIKDAQGRFLAANMATAQIMHAATPKDLIGKSDYDFYPEELAAGFRGDEQEIFRSGKALVDKDEPHVDPQGNLRAILTTKVPFKNAGGETAGLVGIGHDITERMRAEEEIRSRAKEFEELYKTALDLAAFRELPTLLQAIVERAVALLRSASGSIFLYDTTRQDLEIVVSQGIELSVGTRFQLGEGMAGRVAQSREPLIVDDYRRWEQRSPQMADIPITASIAVPMLYGGELIGVLVINEVGDTPRRFAQDETRLLSLFAGQAASAVHINRLLAEASTRAHQLGLLYDAGLALNSVLEPHAQLEFLFQIATKALQADRAEFFRYEPQQRALVFNLGVGHSKEIAKNLDGFTFSVEEPRGLNGWVYQNRAPLNVPDVLADPRYVRLDPDIRSGLWAPVEREHQLLGVLSILSTHPNAFTLQEERLLVLFANQAAVALENSRLFGDLRASLIVSTRLHELSKQLLDTNTLEETVELVCRIVRDCFAADAASIQLVDADGQIEFQHHLGFSAPLNQNVRPRPDGITARTIARGEPVIFADPAQLHPAILAEGIQACIALPLRGQTRTLGLLFVDYRTAHSFPDHEVELLSLFANQAALALERVKLLGETRQRLAELEAINRVSAALREAQTLDEMLPRLLDETLSVLSTTAGSIWLVTPAGDNRTKEIARGWFERVGEYPSGGEEGLASYVLKTGQPYFSGNWKTDPFVRNSVREAIPENWSGACIPIRVSSETIGALFVGVAAPRTLNDNEIHLLTTLAEIAGITIHRMRLHDQTERQMCRLAALHDIDLAITASVDLKFSLEVILDRIRSELAVDAADVFLLKPQLQALEFAASRGFRTESLKYRKLQLGEGPAGRAALERRTIAVADLNADSDGLVRSKRLPNEEFVSYVAAPLQAKGLVKGVLEIFHRSPLRPDDDWFSFLDVLTTQLAIAIDSAESFADLQRSNVELGLAYDTTLEGWSRALDLRDKETEGHTERVMEITLRLAKKMGVPEDELVNIRRGALLHDIGKMGIPDSILLKPGPLTEDEWKIMRQHPEHAHALLSPIAHLRPALDIPFCHHEKWDGTGYPRGLKGNQIPLAARIFSVVDVWDALRSDRPYRGAWRGQQVYKHILEQAGLHFDPKVVQEFLELMEFEFEGEPRPTTHTPPSTLA
jgi:PAS domain S-box-containing protein